ncbi:MAG: amino acid adenylation domain-containing protein, partial [bacterium]|nr:amino acid adenylation domain-containing protein [bacterium]
GLFINTIPVRIRFEARTPIGELLQTVHEDAVNSETYHHYPLADIQAESLLKQNLLDHLFVFENFPIAEKLDGLVNPGKPAKEGIKEEKNLQVGVSNFEMFEQNEYDFGVLFIPGRELTLNLTYNGNVYETRTVERMVNHLNRVFDRLIADEGVRVGEIAVLSEDDKKQLLDDFNDTAADYPKDKTIHEIFEDQVSRTPDRAAVVSSHDHQTLSYRELSDRSGGLAHLLKEKGIAPGAIVGLMMERSLEMIIGLLGILKAGGAYLPIDPDYPRERVDFMLRDSGAKVIVTDGLMVDRLDGLMVIKTKPGEAGESSNQQTNLAYIIYTSGSTGRPKGVLINHRGVVNMVWHHRKVFEEHPGSRISQVASASFDAMASEVWPCLLGGATLCIADDETRTDPTQLKDWLIKTHITISFQSTLMAQQLLDEQWEGTHVSLKSLRTAGDRLTRYPARSYPFRFYNLYGPTEDTIWSTWTEVPVNLSPEAKPPYIGKPIANKQIYIFNRNMAFQPIGVAGELCISGDGLARGYLNNPELTVEKFENVVIRDLHLVLYHTGDLARWVDDGNIEFLGRVDHQVKLRGFRIEPGEIESQLLLHPNVKEAVVVAAPDAVGDKRLIAYMVPRDNTPTMDEAPADQTITGTKPAGGTGSGEFSDEIRTFIKESVPEYMVPAHFVLLDQIPLNTSGKVDRKSLPEPGIELRDQYVAPRDKSETLLVEIWSDVLGIDPSNVGIDSNFFSIGGHSLKATIMVSRVHKAFDVKVPLAEVFRTPSVRQLAEYIHRAAPDRYAAVEPADKRQYYNLSSAQRRLYIIHQMDLESTAYNMPQFIPLGQAPPVETLEAAFKKLIDRHESLRTSFHMIDNQPVQKVHDDVEFEIEFFGRGVPLWSPLHGNHSDVDGNGPGIDRNNPGANGNNPGTHGGVPLRSFIRPFDLFHAPLLRVGMTETGEGKHILMVDMHHIISDGASMQVLINDFTALYTGKQLPLPRLQYKDFAQWQNSSAQKKVIKQQETHWLKQFAGELPALNLPIDYPRPRVQNFEGHSIGFQVSGPEYRALKSLSSTKGVTLYMVLLSIFTIFLSKLSGQEDIVVGTPVAGRRHTSLENIIGMFVNTLSLRNYPSGHKTFIQFLEELKKRTLDSFENQDYQYEDLVEKMDVDMDTSRNPLFDTMFALQNVDIPEVRIPGLKLTPVPFEWKIAKFDLLLACIEKDEHLSCTLEYSTRLFKQETIQRFTGYFNKILLWVSRSHDVNISRIDVLTEEEKQQLLVDFNDTAAEFPAHKTIHRLIEEQVDRIPEHVALAGQITNYKSQITNKDNALITYGQLNEKADRLAHYLYNEKGIRPGHPVAVLMERSMELIIALIGVM